MWVPGENTLVAEEACTAKFVLGKRRSGLELVVVFAGKTYILSASAAGDKLGIISEKEGPDERLRVLLGHSTSATTGKGYRHASHFAPDIKVLMFQ